MKNFDVTELKQGDGSEGHPALVAVEGKVYDVTQSKLWRKGTHLRTHHAGEDLTQGLKAAPHGAEVLERFEQVGVLTQLHPAETAKVPATPPLIEKILREHPHPVSVHFPIALTLVGAFSMALFLGLRAAGVGPLKVLGTPETIEMFALYCVGLATLAAPVSVATGLISWMYNYNMVWTPIYRGKVYLSIALVAMQGMALILRLAVAGGPALQSPAYWMYAGLVLLMAPVVIGLGYLGGLITFPR